MIIRRQHSKSLIAAVLALSLFRVSAASQWPVERAEAWYKTNAWPVGCNFTPSTAVNQLEMWQAETFDPATIDRELGWAQQLGFNTVRVFLHNLPMEEDRQGFLKRIDQFLELADQHHIGVMFVLFDACWDPFPKAGLQRAPAPHVHNSGWVQCPGVAILKDPARQGELKGYVKGVIGRFKTDRRVLAWDLFNEPDNINRPAYVKYEPPNKRELALALLQKEFAWARQINPDQPLTVGLWLGPWAATNELSPLERYAVSQSDVISFHDYGNIVEMRQCVRNLRRFQRPLLCTEYMARPRQSTFDPILGFLKQEKVGAMNWGFVAGKTQTIYPWDSWEKNYAAAPTIWFHDILFKDGTPFDEKEIEYIKGLTKIPAPRASLP